MKIYLVARYGNDDEGPDGMDTLYIVRAGSHLSAAKLVDRALAAVTVTRVQSIAHWICEIGDDGSGKITPAILKGPFRDMSWIDGGGYFNLWTREGLREKWVSRKREIIAASRQRS